MIAPASERLVRIALAPDETTAERWSDALELAGIEAHIRIDDGLPYSRLGSAYGPVTGGVPFVYPLLVPRLQRRRAERVLARLGRQGSEAPRLVTRGSVVAAVCVVAGSMLLVAYLAWTRGGL